MPDPDDAIGAPSPPPLWLCPAILRRLEAVRDSALAHGRDALSTVEDVRTVAIVLLPALPQTMVDEAVAAVMPDPLGREPGRGRTPAQSTGCLKPADPAEVREALTYALCFASDGKRRRSGWDFAAPLAAAHLVQHLTFSGFVVMRRPAARPHGQ